MHQRSFPLIVLCLIFALFASCANRRTAATFNDVETYIQARPDSALATIRAIDTTTLTTRSLRAHYALLHAMALDKNWIDTTDVGVVMPAVEYYDRHPSGIRRAKAWYYLGRIQENGGDIPEASISFLKADRYSENCDEIAFKALVYQAISNVYNKTYLDDEALHYTELSYELSVREGDTLGVNASLYRMAQDLNNVGRYAESDSLYRLLIKGEKIHPNLRASAISNYALGLITHSEQYEQAASLLDTVINTYGSLNRDNYWGAYAYALVRIGKEKRADNIFKQLEKLPGSSSAYVYSYWKSMADASQRKFESAYHSQKKAADLQTENVQKNLQQSAIKAQKDFLEEANLEAERKVRRQQLLASGVVTLFIIFILLLVLLFKRRSTIAAQKHELLFEAYKELTSRTEEEKAKVRNQYIQMCQSHFSHIGRINEMLSVYSKESNNNLYRELKRSIQRVGLDEDSQLRFEKMLDDSFDGVMTHFRDSFPGKKPRFYQLVSYLFAGFGTTTICTIIPGYNKHNIHVEKWRLKQLIQDSESLYKEQFLEMLS